MSELKIGDVVKLKSGGPEMVIDTIDRMAMSAEDGPLYAWVSWMDKKDERQKDSFPLTSLKKFTPRKRAAVKTHFI